jgi:hypothetical protein
MTPRSRLSIELSRFALLFFIDTPKPCPQHFAAGLSHDLEIALPKGWCAASVLMRGIGVTFPQ